MPNIRCFCAIEISDDIKSRINNFRKEIQGNFDKVTWTKSQGLHITMKFLGDQEESKIEVISHALSEVCKENSKFGIDFSGIGFFPGTNRPRVIWVGVKSGVRELIKLNKMIEDKLSMLKIPGKQKVSIPI